MWDPMFLCLSNNFLLPNMVIKRCKKTRQRRRLKWPFTALIPQLEIISILISTYIAFYFEILLYHAALLYSYILSWLYCIIMYSIQADMSGFMNKSPNIIHAIMHQCTNILFIDEFIHQWKSTNALMYLWTNALLNQCSNVLRYKFIYKPMHCCTNAIIHKCRSTQMH